MSTRRSNHTCPFPLAYSKNSPRAWTRLARPIMRARDPDGPRLPWAGRSPAPCPAPAMAAGLVPGLLEPARDLAVAFERHGAGIECDRELQRGEHPHEAPHPRPRAVLEDRFGTEIAI